MATFRVRVPEEHAQQVRTLLEQLCRKVPSAELTEINKESEALAHVTHRGANDTVERMLCDGLVENAVAAADTYGLPAVGRGRESYTTASLASVASVDVLLDRPLPNTLRGNLGADIVVLRRDGTGAPGALVADLIQLKRGTTPIGGTKSTCSPTNEGRSAYHISKKLRAMGDTLTTALTRNFQDTVTTVTCVHHLVTTAPIRPSARAFLSGKHVHVVEGLAAFKALMPEHVRDHVVA